MVMPRTPARIAAAVHGGPLSIRFHGFYAEFVHVQQPITAIVSFWVCSGALCRAGHRGRQERRSSAATASASGSLRQSSPSVLASRLPAPASAEERCSRPICRRSMFLCTAGWSSIAGFETGTKITGIFGGNDQRRNQFVGDAVGDLAEDIDGRRIDDDQVCVPRKLDVRHVNAVGRFHPSRRKHGCGW